MANEIVLGAYATSNISEGEIILARDDKIIFIDKISLKPEKSYFKKIINSTAEILKVKPNDDNLACLLYTSPSPRDRG